MGRRADAVVRADSGEWWAESARAAPRDPSLEVLLHQTLVGAHPLSAERAHAYLDKAMREAKTVTNWIDTDETFESAAHATARPAPDRRARTVASSTISSARSCVPGRVNALAQKLIALTVPGVPDIYQGSELWALDLVDPDNRRPVDYRLRRSLLDDAASAERLSATWSDPDDAGAAKLHVVRQALAVRRERPGSFLGDCRHVHGGSRRREPRPITSSRSTAARATKRS